MTPDESAGLALPLSAAARAGRHGMLPILPGAILHRNIFQYSLRLPKYGAQVFA